MLAPREKLQRRTIGWRSLRRFLWERCAGLLADLAPKGLYARALIIIIAPIVLLESVVAFTFMERHWNQVTRRLSEAAARNIGAIVDLYSSRAYTDEGRLAELAQKRFGLTLTVMEPGELPKGGEAKPFFDLLDRALSEEIGTHLAQMPVWIDTVGQSRRIEIRVKLDDAILRFTAPRALAYASNSHIFLVWMGGSSFVLLGIAILFLRNQIRPILRLAEAAESLGKGREVDFRPRGAREVRQAGHAFLEMKRRIERNLEQRTTMLNGVSHDLRTILTRFKLSLVFLDQTAEVEDLKRDVDEMSRMLEGYLAFARGESGDAGEQAVPTDLRQLLEEVQSDAERQGHVTELDIVGDPIITVRPDAFRRLLFNLVGNAARHGDRIEIIANHETRWLILHVDDDGPGIPADKREEVFKPFVRLDEARNQDEGGSGLGLAIARDVARTHGGDIVLGESPLGGLRATVRLPA